MQCQAVPFMIPEEDQKGKKKHIRTAGGSTFSSWMDSIWPSFRAAPRMRQSASASLSAFCSVRYRLPPCF